MTTQTRLALVALLGADGTVSQDRKAAAIAILNGETPKIAPRPPCSRKEAATIIGCCVESITHYADEGKIRRVFGPTSRRGSRGRSVRFNREDCERIARGEGCAAAGAAA